MTKKDHLLVLMMTTRAGSSFMTGAFLVGLQRHNPRLFDEIVIYTGDEFPQEEQDVFRAAIPGVPLTFIRYTYTPHPVSARSRANLAYFTHLVYSRFEIFSYLDRFKKVLSLDCDVLIRSDISSIMNCARTGISMVEIYLPPGKGYAYADDSAASGKTTVESHFFEGMFPDGFDRTVPVASSTPLLISDTLVNPLAIRDWLYEKAELWKEAVSVMDQSIENLMLQAFSLKNDVLPKYTYGPFLQEDTTEACMIHAAGPGKFWKHYGSALAFPQWEENYAKWLDLGGTPMSAGLREPKHDFRLFYRAKGISFPDAVLETQLYALEDAISRLERKVRFLEEKTSLIGMIKRYGRGIRRRLPGGRRFD